MKTNKQPLSWQALKEKALRAEGELAQVIDLAVLESRDERRCLRSAARESTGEPNKQNSKLNLDFYLEN